MTRREFEGLARVLSQAKPHLEDKKQYAYWANLVQEIASFLKIQTPGFNLDRFLSACSYFEQSPTHNGARP